MDTSVPEVSMCQPAGEAPAVESAGKRKYTHYGDLVKVAAKMCGRTESTVYAVLRGRMKSKPVSKAIQKAEARLIRKAERQLELARRKAA